LGVYQGALLVCTAPPRSLPQPPLPPLPQ
jgi:hypothetical protein